MHGQRHLGKLGAHAQQGAHPHPEYRARPPDGDGAGHARDVARAHRGRQRRAHGLEGGHGPVLRGFFLEHAPQRGPDGQREFANLQEAGTQAQVQSHTENAHHGRNAPHEIVDRLVDGRNEVQNGNRLLCVLICTLCTSLAGMAEIVKENTKMWGRHWPFFRWYFWNKKQTAWGRGCGASPPDRKRKIIRGETA